jgi:integrase
MARAKRWAGGYVDPVSGCFFIRRQVGGARHHFSTRCKTKDGALAELARWESNPGAYVPGAATEDRRRDTFDSCVTDYLDYSKNVRGNSDKHVHSQAAYADNWVKYLTLKSITMIGQITPSVCDDYQSWRRQGGVSGEPVGPDSVALDVAFIKSLFTWASRLPNEGGFLPENPLLRYHIPKRPRGGGKVKAFDMGWWESVRAHLSNQWANVGDVLLGSSIRYSSLARLQLDDVDTTANTLTLRGNKIKGGRGVVVYVSHRVALAAAEIALKGIPAETPNFNHALVGACGAAGVPYLSCHCFRHTAASQAIEDGVTGKELQQRLAHASFATTEGYLHRLGKATNQYRGRI